MGRHALAALLFLAMLVHAADALASLDEYRIKAAFLLNFAKLVEWPAAARPAEGEPLVLGVMGGEGATQTISDGLRDARVESHPVQVRSVSGASDVAGCHIVFVAAGHEDSAILEAAGGNAALSVGESEGFTERGGIINFVNEGEKLRFEINPQAADRAGLEISSRLLQLAILVSEQ